MTNREKWINPLYKLAQKIDEKLNNDFDPEKLWNFKVSDSFGLNADGKLDYWESYRDTMLYKYSSKVNAPRWIYTTFRPKNLYTHYTHKTSCLNPEDLPYHISIYEIATWGKNKECVPDDLSGRRNFFDSEYYAPHLINTPTLGWNFKDLIPTLKFSYCVVKRIYDEDKSTWIKSNPKEIQKIINTLIPTKKVLTDTTAGNNSALNILFDQNIIFDHFKIAFGPGSGLFLRDVVGLRNNFEYDSEFSTDQYFNKKTIIKQILNILSKYRIILPMGDIEISISSTKDDTKTLILKIEFPYGNIKIPKAKGIISELKPIEDLDWYLKFKEIFNKDEDIKNLLLNNVDDLSSFSGGEYRTIKKLFIKENDNIFSPNKTNLKDWEEYNLLKKLIKEKKIFLRPFYDITERLFIKIEKLGPEIFQKFYNIIKIN